MRRILVLTSAFNLAVFPITVNAQQCPDGTPPPCRAAPRRAAALPRLGSRPFTIVAELDGTAPADVRAAAKNLVISALDESGVLAALPEDQIRLGLTLAGKPETTRVDVSTARELAVRGAVRTVITGTIDQVGQTYHAAVRVLDADSNVVVASRRDIARGEDDLIPTLDRLVRAVRVDLGERRAAIRANRRLDQAATPSFAAYQRYRQASELLGDGDLPAAVAEFKAAVALDPAFAMAWRGLSAVYSNLGFRDSALSAVDAALSHPDRFTEGQRFEVGGLRARILGDFPAALAAQERAHRLNVGRPWLLSMALVELGRVREAVALIEEWERSTPFGLSTIQRATVAVWLLPLGRFDEARRRAEALPGSWGNWPRLELAAWTADWPAAESLATTLRGRTPIFGDVPLMAQASVAAARGRVRDALGILASCCRRAEFVLRVVSGAPVTMAQLAGSSPDTTATGRLLTALWSAAAGDTAAARAILTRVRGLPPQQRGRADALAALVEAWLEAVAGRPAEVVRLLRPLAKRGVPNGPSVKQPVDWLLAAAYEREGQLDSAAAQLERLATWQGAWVNDRNLRGLTHSFAHQRLVVLYSRLGRPADARRHWQVFSETFTSPDPEMQHLVDEARTAVVDAERRR